MPDSLSRRMIDEVIRLYPEYAADPLDVQWNKGNATVMVIEPDGTLSGHMFGTDQDIGQKCYEVATRKVMQVWRTGHLTGKFEELVYAGKLNENDFGIQRPTFIGWEGGVPIVDAEGRLFAAAFSGFRGQKDIEILERAANTVGLTVKRDRSSK